MFGIGASKSENDPELKLFLETNLIVIISHKSRKRRGGDIYGLMGLG
jgi:hypothetical protein